MKISVVLEVIELHSSVVLSKHRRFFVRGCPKILDCGNGSLDRIEIVFFHEFADTLSRQQSERIESQIKMKHEEFDAFPRDFEPTINEKKVNTEKTWNKCCPYQSCDKFEE